MKNLNNAKNEETLLNSPSFFFHQAPNGILEITSQEIQQLLSKKQKLVRDSGVTIEDIELIKTLFNECHKKKSHTWNYAIITLIHENLAN